MRVQRNETTVDLVHCAQCQFTSEDLSLTRCPRDGAVLGETTVTCRPDPVWCAQCDEYATAPCPGCGTWLCDHHVMTAQDDCASAQAARAAR